MSDLVPQFDDGIDLNLLDRHMEQVEATALRGHVEVDSVLMAGLATPRHHLPGRQLMLGHLDGVAQWPHLEERQIPLLAEVHHLDGHPDGSLDRRRWFRWRRHLDGRGNVDRQGRCGFCRRFRCWCRDRGHHWRRLELGLHAAVLDSRDEHDVIADLEVVHGAALGPREAVLVEERESRARLAPGHVRELVVRLRGEEEAEVAASVPEEVDDEAPAEPQGIERPTDTPPVPDTLDWDLWLGPAPWRPYHPAYVPFKWRGWWDFGSGGLGDMGIHNLAPVFDALKLGPPVSVHASSTPVFKETVPLAAKVHYEFAARGDMPAVKLHWYDGGLLPERPEELEADRPLDPEDGIIFVGDKGKILVRGWGGESPENSLRLLEEVNSPALKLLYDTGNVIAHDQDGWDFYSKTREHIVYVHIKDAVKTPDGKIHYRYCGEGNGQVRRILTDLIRNGYDGGFSIEPHLKAIIHESKDADDPLAGYKAYVEYGRRLAAILKEARAAAGR